MNSGMNEKSNFELKEKKSGKDSGAGEIASRGLISSTHMIAHNLL